MRFTEALDELCGLMSEVGETVPGTGTLGVARQITETVRALAAAVARYDLGARRQQLLLKRYPDLDRVDKARDMLGSACTWLRPTVTDPAAGSGDPPLPELTWPDPALRGIAHAVVEQTPAQVGPKAVGDADGAAAGGAGRAAGPAAALRPAHRPGPAAGLAADPAGDLGRADHLHAARRRGGGSPSRWRCRSRHRATTARSRPAS